MPDAPALLSVAMKYEDGSVPAEIASPLHDQYIEVERPFVRSQNSPGDVLFEVRDANRGDLASLVEVSASHVLVKVKNGMVVTFIAGYLRPVSHEQAGRRYASCWGSSSPTAEIMSIIRPSFFCYRSTSSNSACRSESTTGLSSSLDSLEIIG
jgi:Acetyl-CoA carboxylase, central region